jgi:hypothetical protein
MRLLLALYLALIIAFALVLVPLARGADNGCSRWQSLTRPPTSIRVLIGRRVHRVDAELYVARVTASEWGSTPTELRKAGAVAVHQYSWFKAMHPRRSQYGCFDVHDDVRDQIYRVKTPPARVWMAVLTTWNWRIYRDGGLPMTGYRTGAKVGCARDANGWKLYARSATKCALLGWSAARILTAYYEGRLVR